jgi:hypothetical protein
VTDEKRKKLLDVPADLLDRVTSLGKRNHRSANAEIVVAIEERLEREAHRLSDLDPTRKDSSHAREENRIGDPHRRGR